MAGVYREHERRKANANQIDHEEPKSLALLGEISDREIRRIPRDRPRVRLLEERRSTVDLPIPFGPTTPMRVDGITVSVRGENVGVGQRVRIWAELALRPMA